MTNKEVKNMTKVQAIKKLNKAHKNYNLNVETAGNAGVGVFTVKAFIQAFDLEKLNGAGNPTVTKNSTGYGFDSDVNSAQEKAIIQAIENLGL
jgi:hypothetical protein